MDAIEFIKERNRMCDYYKDDRCWNDNEQCPAFDCECNDFRNAADDEFKIVNVVEQWSKNHPKKTMLRDFLEKFPNAKLEGDCPLGCPYIFGYTSINDDYNVCPGHTCLECWSRPVEE